MLLPPPIPLPKPPPFWKPLLFRARALSVLGVLFDRLLRLLRPDDERELREDEPLVLPPPLLEELSLPMSVLRAKASRATARNSVTGM
jgi:hypothetical protein